MTIEERDNKIDQVIAKTWIDHDFKQKLLSSPAGTLKAEGLQLPAGVEVRVVENTDKVFHLVLPHAPVELSDEELDKVAGGFQMMNTLKNLLSKISGTAAGITGNIK